MGNLALLFPKPLYVTSFLPGSFHVFLVLTNCTMIYSEVGSCCLVCLFVFVFLFCWTLGELVMSGDYVLQFCLYVIISTSLFSAHHFFSLLYPLLILYFSYYHLFNVSYFVLLLKRFFNFVSQSSVEFFFGYCILNFRRSVLIFDCSLLLAFLLCGWNILRYFFNII